MSQAGHESGRATAGGTRFLENLAYLVPGYRGYKDKELRREEDARLRGRVLAKLQILCRLIEDRLARLTERSLGSEAEQLDRRLRRVESVADAVRYAPYGFSGFFDVEQVRERTLDRLLEADLLLFQDLDETIGHLGAAAFPPRSRAALTGFLEELDTNLDRIEARLVTRDKILGDA